MDPDITNVVYGHVSTTATASTWLQYWYCYFYNDYNLIGKIIRAGLHEGDWEMVQLRLGGPDRTPDLAVYAQHAARRAARVVAGSRRSPGTQRPVVYPARGSHAAYFTAGTHWTGHGSTTPTAGARARTQRLVEVVSGDATRRWIRWLGHWGDTHAGGSPMTPTRRARPGSTGSGWTRWRCSTSRPPPPRPRPTAAARPPRRRSPWRADRRRRDADLGQRRRRRRRR